MSTFKYSPGSAMEHEGGHCNVSPTGKHWWKFGQCSHCHVAEGRVGLAPRAAQGMECDMGGKCAFKFARCTKCGRRE